MDDKSLLACAETKEAITKEQAEASAELGWLTVPDQTEESQARFLVRPVASKEEAASVLERLAQLETTPEVISGLVFEPYLKDPLSVPASAYGIPEGKAISEMEDHPSREATKKNQMKLPKNPKRNLDRNRTHFRTSLNTFGIHSRKRARRTSPRSWSTTL